MIEQGDAQLGLLLALKRQLSQAGPAAVAAVRAEVVACIANASAIAKQAEVAVANGPGPATSIASASQAARAAVASFQDDFYKKKIFDPYLHFESSEDEKAYREREAEFKRQIEEAQARHTPEGDLAASKLAIAQLQDAGAHGADQSPDFRNTLDGLKQSASRLDAQITGTATSKAFTAAHKTPDPLDEPVRPQQIAPEILAALKASGISCDTAVDAGHGLSGAKPQSQGPHLP